MRKIFIVAVFIVAGVGHQSLLRLMQPPKEAGVRSVAFETLDLAGLLQLRGMRNVVLIDTRTERLYEAGHIEKALAPPFDTAGKFDPVRVDAIRKHDAVVLYCDSSSCGTVYKIARRLKALNLPQIYIYTGGFSEWKTCGLPVEKGNDRT